MRWPNCAVFLRSLFVAAVSLMLTLSAFSQLDPHSGSWPISKVPGVVPKVGDSIAPRHDSTACLINSAQIDPCYFTDVDGISYQVAYRSEGNAFRVTYVQTSDPGFITPDGLKIGDMIAISKEDDLILAPYFAVYANRGKVWIPVVGNLQGDVAVARRDGKDKMVPINQLHLGDGQIHVRISAFVQRDGVVYGSSVVASPKL